MRRWAWFLIAAILVGGIAVAVNEFVPRRVDLPAPGAGADLEARLAGQAQLLPAGDRVMTWIFDYAESKGDRGTMILALDPDGTLPTAGLVERPQELLARPDGRYLSVEDGRGFVFVVPLSDPRIVIGEEWDGTRFSRATARLPEGGTSSVRIPFAPNGRLTVFEVSGGRVSRVFLHFEMPGSPYPERGRRFLVPYS